MRTLQFKVTGQNLSKDGDFSGIVAGTKGYLYTEYNFDSEWDGCRKAAVFSRYDKEYPVPIVNGKCVVPDEITGYNRWKVYLVEEKAGYRITTNDGGYTAQCTVNVAENTVDPSESHTELESLSVDGNCYFDTEILPDQNTNTEAKLYVKSGTTYICGARDDKYKYGYSVTDNFYVVRGSVSSAVKNTAFWEDAWTIKQNGATATFGNNSVTLDNAGNFTLTSPYYIGCMSKNGEAAGAGLKGKIYYAKIYSGSNLVADMIPVKKSDGTLCLYDKVRKKYIYNAGTGTLKEG